MVDRFEEMAKTALRNAEDDLDAFEDGATIFDAEAKHIAAALRQVAQNSAREMQRRCAEVARSHYAAAIPESEGDAEGYNQAALGIAAAIEALDLSEARS